MFKLFTKTFQASHDAESHWQFHRARTQGLPAEHTHLVQVRSRTQFWVIKNEINFFSWKNTSARKRAEVCQKVSAARNPKKEKSELAGRCLVRKWSEWPDCVLNALCARKARLVSWTNCSHSNAPAHREKIIEHTHWQRPVCGWRDWAAALKRVRTNRV